MRLPRLALWSTVLLPLAAGAWARWALSRPVPVTTASGLAMMADELLVVRGQELWAFTAMGDARVVLPGLPADTRAVTADDAGHVYVSTASGLYVVDPLLSRTQHVPAPAWASMAWACDRLVGVEHGGGVHTFRGDALEEVATVGVIGVFRAGACGHVGAWTPDAVGDLDLADGSFTPWFPATVRSVLVLGDRVLALEGDELVERLGGHASRRDPAHGIVQMAGPFATGVAGLTPDGQVWAIPR